MLLFSAMDPLYKLALSAHASSFESDGQVQASSDGQCGYTPAQIRQRYGSGSSNLKVEADGHKIPIHLAAVPGGRRFPLLKAMLTTACERNCFYCPFRAGRNYKRVSFQAGELAHTFHAAHKKGLVDGLFLSTGIFAGGTQTQDRLIETAELLRQKLAYRGYLHLKIMPGAEYDQVYRAMQLADRVSTNLEAPNPSRLASLAPQKEFDQELLQPLKWIEKIRRTEPPHLGWRGRWPSSTTQFVVGAAGEKDLELLATVAALNRDVGIKRAYFEAFNPIPGTPFENYPQEDPTRQHRLYQASFLLRDYGYNLEELPFNASGELPLHKDPKSILADHLYVESPVEMNNAARDVLLRIPGIGPRSASAVLHARRKTNLSDIGQLRRLGVLAERAAPYITLAGQRPARQLKLF